MLTEHLAVIEEELTSFAGHLESERDGWKEGSDAYKRYCVRLAAIDAALAAVRQEREQGTWEPLPDGCYYDEDGDLEIEVEGKGSTMLVWEHGDEEPFTVPYDLPNDWRLCRRTQSLASQQEA